MQQAFYIIGGLGLFLFGMKVMSEGLQLVAGERMRVILRRMTGNRIAGTITGLTITAIIQSSSATTVMVVSLVNAGLISLYQSIGVMFGADVGTTMTAWIVTLFGFNIKISTFALPAIGLGFFVKLILRGRGSHWGDVIMGFGLLFLGLYFLKLAVPDAASSPEIHEWICRYNASTFGGTILVLLVGTAVTALIQSSSATTAIVLVMASTGLLDMRTAMVLFLGANIGTTTTALIASIGASRDARRAALAHLLFKVIGALWVLSVLDTFGKFVDLLWPGSPEKDYTSMLFHLAVFHTTFNLINTIIFLPFVKQFASLVQKIIPRQEEEEMLPHLRFIDSHLLNTPTLGLASARLEIQRMVKLVREMFNITMDVFMKKNAKTDSVTQSIKEREQIVDMLEKEITDFLAQVSRSTVSHAMAKEIAGLITATSDLERIGDHCENLLKLILRKKESNLSFTENAGIEIRKISDEVRNFLSLLEKHIAPKTGQNIMKLAGDIEKEINAMRSQMRDSHIRRLNESTCNVDAGLIFLDMVTSFEKIGDHSYNVAEVISGLR